MNKKIVIATSNQGKIKELHKILNLEDTTFISQNEFNVPECPEPFSTFIENSLAKARHASKYTQLPAIADDSGICIPDFAGKPSIHSARWADLNNYGQDILNKDERNNAYLCHKLRNLYQDLNYSPQHKITAYYYCTIVMVKHEFDPTPIIASASLYGEIQLEAKGENGFGYDPHFYLAQFDKTVAQLSAEEKNQISHRKLAINKLMLELKELV
ncbi:MAG: hypothetical protein RLZZ210_324 [Pseudomonadota bacterium]|jgi:XTP/dITP diphosphohydrolase